MGAVHMRVQRLPLLGVFVLGGLGGCSHAAPAPTVPTSAVPPSLAFYIGTWKCDGTGYDEHGAATEHMKLEIRVAPAIDNWLHVDVFEKGKQLTAELKGVDAKGAFHHLWTATDGSSGTLTSTAGWKDNALVFEEDHPLPTEKSRMIFAKKDATHYTHRAEVDTGNGYQLIFEKTCQK